jgi:DNA repair photolyase
VDVQRRVLELVAPCAIGGELAPQIRLVGVSTDLGPRLAFDVAGQRVLVELSPIEEGRPHAAKTERMHLAYRSPARAPIDPAVGLDLCRRVASRVAANEARVLAGLEEEAQARDDVRVREARIERFLELGELEGRAYYAANPYVGCLVGCRFCYAQSRTVTTRRLLGLRDVPWGSYTEVRMNAAEVLERELLTATPAPIKLCPIASDAYQPIESRYGITRACLEVLARAKRPFPPLVLTRTTLILRDRELLASIPGAGVGASIPTVDDDVRRHFEPRAAPIADRLAMLASMREAGVRAYAMVQPMMPGSIEALADALASVVSSVSLGVLTSVEGAEQEFSGPNDVRDGAWQMERLLALREALSARGVATWPGDLPPDLG